MKFLLLLNGCLFVVPHSCLMPESMTLSEVDEVVHSEYSTDSSPFTNLLRC